jgi:hypothetical protein
MGGPPGVLETAMRIVERGGAPEFAERAVTLRREFEARTGEFSPDDAWFEVRSRAFWSDAITRSRFGREVEASLDPHERRWLGPLERAHRGLFRVEGRLLVDVWSGAVFGPTVVDDASRAELDAGAGLLFDARVVGSDDPHCVALLPGAVFHPREATAAIESVLVAARNATFSTHDTLDRLLLMERTLRSLSRVKAAYAYRPDALLASQAGAPGEPVRRSEKRLP